MARHEFAFSGLCLDAEARRHLLLGTGPVAVFGGLLLVGEASAGPINGLLDHGHFADFARNQ